MKKNFYLCLSLILCYMTAMILIGCERKMMNGIEFVNQMGAGWNLGNSLESRCDDGSCEGNELETYWKNPKTTAEMIKEIKNAGFDTLRIPITWDNHLDSEGKIKKEWMQRVREVVDYAINEDMYVIINAHHDEWFQPYTENEEKAVLMMQNIWEQIGEEFIEYDSHLLFEGMNEPRCIGTQIEWTGGNEETARIVNRLNQTFVDTIRSQGENNQDRYLMVTTYGNSVSDNALKYFEMPKGDNLIVSLHAYEPVDFAMYEQGEAVWQKLWETDLKKLMGKLNTQFVAKGIPVIISEFGAKDKNNTDERIKWLKAYLEIAKENDIPCYWWDEGGISGETYGYFRIFDREKLSWLFPEIKDLLTK